MPNVSIFIPADKMPSNAALSSLTCRCTELCTDILQAALENVHVIYVSVRHGRGHPAFADIRYRLAASRTPPVMERFMGNSMPPSVPRPASPLVSVASATRRKTFTRATDPPYDSRS